MKFTTREDFNFKAKGLRMFFAFFGLLLLFLNFFSTDPLFAAVLVACTVLMFVLAFISHMALLWAQGLEE